MEIVKQLKVFGLPYGEDRFPWFFPGIGEYTTLMEDVGFQITFANYFARPTSLDGVDGLRNWIEMFGKTMFTELDNQTINLIVTNVENNLKQIMFDGNNWIADYKKIRVVGIKM